jgi:hypothetical protein
MTYISAAFIYSQETTIYMYIVGYHRSWSCPQHRVGTRSSTWVTYNRGKLSRSHLVQSWPKENGHVFFLNNLKTGRHHIHCNQNSYHPIAKLFCYYRYMPCCPPPCFKIFKKNWCPVYFCPWVYVSWCYSNGQHNGRQLQKMSQKSSGHIQSQFHLFS